MNWTSTEMHAGKFTPISELVEKGFRFLEIDGNTQDGWQIYSRDKNGVGLRVSPHFHKDYGDLKRDCVASCVRAYGVKPKQGNNYLL